MAGICTKHACLTVSKDDSLSRGPKIYYRIVQNVFGSAGAVGHFSGWAGCQVEIDGLMQYWNVRVVLFVTAGARGIGVGVGVVSISCSKRVS